jgi:phosphatidylglycerol lysyltransferase
MAPWWRSARWCGALLAVAAVAWELHRVLHGLSREDLALAWHDTSPAALGWSLVATAVSFACLAGYERFASQQVAPGRIPVLTALRVGAISHAIANTLGFHALTAGLLRYRLYRPQTLGKADVARMMAVVAACLAAGVIVTMLLAEGWLRAGVPGLVVALGLSLLLCWSVPAAMVRVRRLSTYPYPGPVCMLGLIVVGMLETAAALGALYVLLPVASDMPTLVQFLPIFVGATVLGIVSHAPGGVGVFETAILTMLPGHAPEVLVSLLSYRVIYNLLPFSIAGVVAMASLRDRGTAISSTAGSAGLRVAGAGTGARVARYRSGGAHADGWQR